MRDRNCKKSMRERKVWQTRKMSDMMGREKKMNFGNEITEILVLSKLYPWSAPMHARGSARMVYQLWQPSCRNCRELRREKIWIVAIKLLKMGGIKKKVLRPQYFYNIFTKNYRWLVVINSNLNLTLRLLF